MYSKIILNNWKSHPGKFFLMFSALAIGLIIITLLSTLNTGLKEFFLGQGQKEKILRELHVTPRGNKLDLSIVSLIPQAKISPATIEKIAALPQVSEVLPTNTISGISSLQIGLLGQWFQTDALLFGAPYPLLDSPDISAEQWNRTSEPYPAVVSSRLIDLYNLSFANANNLPQLTEKNFIGSEITILLNQSTFFDQTSAPAIPLKAKIVGFSPNTKLIGLTLPSTVIKDINAQYLNEDNVNYLDAIVRVQSPEDLSLVQQQLIDLGLSANTAEQSLKTLESVFTMTDLALNLFFTLMMLLAGLLISSTFLAKISEKTREIAILKTLGLTGLRVALLYLLEAFLVGVTASIGGILLAFLISLPLESLLQHSTSNLLNHPEHFFIFTPVELLWLAGFTTFIACLFAFFPARKAARLDPMAILSK